MAKKTLFLYSALIFITVNGIKAQPGGFGGRGGMRGGMDGGMGPGMRGGMNGTTQLVETYDNDNNGWLNAEERETARQSMTNRQSRGMGGMGRGGFRTTTSAGLKLTPADVKLYSDESLYDIKTLRTLFLEFEDNDWESELEDFYHTDVDVPAKLIVDGKTYENVGVRFRGNTSYQMAGTGSKRPLNISVDFINKNQYLYGYRTLNLLNSINDPTYMRQVLYHHIARQYIAAPKVNYVRLVINGENWGIYINVQQFNTDFIMDEFDVRKGARWKVPQMSPNGGLVYVGDNAESYKRIYEIKSKDKPESWASLINLCKVLDQTPPEELENELRPILDIDGVLKFLAIENALINSDGYWVRASDYLIYQDPTGRFHIFPYDTSETLNQAEGGPGGGRGGRGGMGGSSDKPLLTKLLAVPSLKQRYLGYIRDISENWLDWNKIEPLVKQYQTLIAADIEKDTRKTTTTAAFYSGIDSSGQNNSVYNSFSGGRGGRGGPGGGASISLKSFFEQRRSYLLSQTQVSQANLP
ncbi:MAG: CotH kinase family protein [Sedimentisphaerales bacterium]|nr:CotH kinase family protein [Sedimentisphaerales bacterium]